MSKYVSLHNYSSYSIGVGLADPKELFEKTKELGQGALAITDNDTMAGIWNSFKISQKTGVKLIVGCNFNFCPDLSEEDTRLTKLILIAKNHNGYKNLLKLRKLGFDNMVIALKKSHSRIDWKILSKHCEDLICLSSNGNGYIPQLIMADKLDLAKKEAERFHGLFGDDFALELQPTNIQIKSSAYSGDVDQRKINLGLKKIHDETGIQCVVTTCAYYLNKEDYKSHDVLACIASGQPQYSGQRFKLDKNENYVKTEEEVRSYFERHKTIWSQEFIDSMIDNSALLADKCEDPVWVDPKFSNSAGKELPEFPVKDQYDYQEFLTWKANYSENSLADDVLYYRYIVENGLKQKLNKNILNKEMIREYDDRIREELEVLEYHGFSSYMLIVWDYIKFCTDNNLSTSPGRGSIGSVFTAFLIDIHAADPIKYGLIFARFHNKQKKSFPDIDVDFASSCLEQLHNYIRNKYGDEYVAHVSNLNTITPKVYARDLSRTFEFGNEGRSIAVEIGNSIADSVNDDAKSISGALENSPLFAEFAKQYPELAEHKMLNGKIRAWSTHAAGLVISKRPLDEIVSIRKDVHNSVCLEVNKNDAEDLGLVKMDTLGLETVDIIKETYRIIESVGKELPAEPFDYNQYDEKTYDLISRGDVSCVFQLAGVSGPVCKIIKPRSIEDIALVTALIRPAAKDIIPDFIKVRSGEKKLELIHPYLGRALNGTYGFALFEESLMFIAADVAGWDLHKADDLRKMTKDKGKYPEKVEKIRQDFIRDAQLNKGLSENEAVEVFKIIEVFQGYGFNKSHAVLYSMISFHTAYLKAHYPLEFLVANLMSKVVANSPKAKDEVLRIKQEIRNIGVKIIQPNVNTSELSYKIIDDNTLMTGLDSLRGVKEAAIDELRLKRPFSSYKDLVTRTDSSKVRSPVIQSLAVVGALDSFNLRREHMFFYCTDYRNKLKALRLSLDKKVQKNKATQEQVDIEFNDFEYPFPKDEPKWQPHEIYALEERFIGEGLTGGLKERFPKFFNSDVYNIFDITQKKQFIDTEDDIKERRKLNTYSLDVFGCYGLKTAIIDIHEFTVKNEESKIFGQTMARLKMQDLFGNIYSVVAFPTAWEAAKQRVEQLSAGKTKIEAGIALYFNGVFQWENMNTYSIILGDILSYKDAPKVPKSLKSKKVKISRFPKLSAKDILESTKEDLLESIENELVFNAITSDDEFEFV